MKHVANTVVVAVHEQLIKTIKNPHLNETLAGTLYITKEIINLSLQQLSAAYGEEDLASRETVQRSLFLIYNCLLADPLSAAAKNQHHPFLMMLMNLIQSHWLVYKFRRYPCTLPDKNVDAPSVIDDLLELYHTIDNKHTLYHREQIEVDIDHAVGLLEHVITPLINMHPPSAGEFIMRATLRLQSCADYYDSLSHKMTY